MQALLDFFNFEAKKAKERLDSLTESLELATIRRDDARALPPKSIGKLAIEMEREQVYGVFFERLIKQYNKANAKGDMTPFIDECLCCLTDEYKNYSIQTVEIKAAREARHSLLKALIPFLTLRPQLG
jgi:hypothetical protein